MFLVALDPKKPVPAVVLEQIAKRRIGEQCVAAQEPQAGIAFQQPTKSAENHSNHSAASWGIFGQLKVQAAAVGIAVCYAAVVTLILAFVLDRVLGLRLAKEDEMSGMDHCLHGEQAYGMLNLG